MGDRPRGGNRHDADSFSPAHGGAGEKPALDKNQQRKSIATEVAPTGFASAAAFGPAMLFAHVPDVCVATQEKVTRAPKEHETILGFCMDEPLKVRLTVCASA